MAYYNQQNPTQAQAPFWDFIRSLDASAGVDHAPHEETWGHPMGGFPFGFGGPEGRRGRGGWGRGGFGQFGGPGPFGRPGPHGHGGPGGRHGGPGPHGRGRRGCRHNRSPSHEREGEEAHGEFHDESHDESHGSRSPSPDTLRERSHSPHPPPPPHDGPGPHHGPGRHGRHGPGPRRHGPHGGRRGGPHAGPFGHGGPHGRGRGPRGPPPPPPYGAPFDMSALLGSLAGHPLAQVLRSFTEQAGFTPPPADARDAEANAEAADVTEDGVQKFTPPLDVFSTPSAYILHVALPGAKKEDVGVNWDAEKKVLNIAGVVYRAGDEEFLKTLTVGERKVGMFEREVRLGDEGEVDGDDIKAKLEDGVLVVTVSKVEKEWTDVKRIDIE